MDGPEDPSKKCLRISPANILTRHTSALLFIFCFLFLIGFRPHALFYPPYWDSLVGPFTEALWLFDHRFDYIKLALQESCWANGGARVYFFSIYPTVQALLMTAIKNTPIFLLVNHLTSLALSSGIVAFSFETMKKVVDPGKALLACALMFLNPLYLSQTYAINMEIPTLFGGVLAVYYFMTGKERVAAVFSLLSFYTKTSGIVFALALSIVFFLRETGEKKSKGTLALLLMPIGLYILQNLFAARFFHDYSPANSFALNGFSAYLTYIRQDPDIFLLFFFIFLALPGIAIAKGYRSVKDTESFLNRNPFPAICLILILSQYAFTVLLKNCLPRYFLICFPSMFFLLVWTLQHIRLRWLTLSLTAALFLFYSLTMFGPWDKNTAEKQDGHLLERNLGYEDNMEANLEAAKLLETKYKNHRIVTTWPIAHMLADPKFGYVQTPLNVIETYQPDLAWKPNVRYFGALDPVAADFGKDWIWIWAPNSFWFLTKPAPEQGDTFLDVIKKQRSVLFIFKKPKKYYDALRLLHGRKKR